MEKLLLIYFLIFCYSCALYPQEKVDCNLELLHNQKEEELFQMFKRFKNDTLSYRKCGNKYIKYAREQNDIIKESNGLYLMGLLSKEEEAIKYADSIILITKDVKNDIYPARAHLLKARNLGRKENYEQALNELLKADFYATKNDNKDQKNDVRFFIGILKINLGELEESLEYYKSANKYYTVKYENDKSYQTKYLRSLFAVTNGYTRLKKYDSAYISMKKGMKLSIKTGDSLYYGYFLLSSGIIQYFKKNHTASLDSLSKFNSLFKNYIKDGNESIANLYIGKNYYDLNYIEKSKTYLQKVHSIPPLDLRLSYELLLKIYQEQNNPQMQIEYIDKIVSLDSVINQDFKFLYTNIEEKYSSPNLLLEKQKIIESLKESTKTNRIVVYFLTSLLFLSSVLLFYNYYKKKAYKKRFLKLYNNSEPNKDLDRESDDSKSKGLNIPSDVVQDILEKLGRFEKNKKFLEHNITVAKLAKDFETNSRYLSNLINAKKGKNFSNYINDLRINHTIEELKKNNTFRKYTIKAISHEVGFKSSEIFSKLFHKKTGIYPSYFLKELEKRENL